VALVGAASGERLATGGQHVLVFAPVGGDHAGEQSAVDADDAGGLVVDGKTATDT